MVMLRMLLTVASSVLLPAGLPDTLIFAAPTPTPPQSLQCVTHYKQNNTIYIRNGCSDPIWWAVCIRRERDEVDLQHNAPEGLLPTDSTEYYFGPAPFRYRLLSGPTLDGLECDL